MIYLVSPCEKGILNNARDRPNLGVLYLSAALKTNNVDHRVFDLNHINPNDLLYRISKTQPKYVGVSCMSPTAKQMISFANRVHALSPRTQIIAGGVHVTNEQGSFQHEMIGPGESQLVSMITGKSEVFDINRYPIPNRDAVEHRYTYSIDIIGRTATMITSRGCPNSCSFCSVPDKKQIRRNLDNITEELDWLVKRGYQSVHFYDDTFTLNEDHAIGVMNEAFKRNLRYRIEARANMLNKDITNALDETKCHTVAIGIESGDDEILSKCYKGVDTETIRSAVSRMSRHGMKVKGFFIIGLPGETEKSAYKTVIFAEELRSCGLTSADFYPLQPYAGSAIANDPEKFGIKILDKDYSHYLNGGKELFIPTETEGLKADKARDIINVARSRWKN